MFVMAILAETVHIIENNTVALPSNQRPVHILNKYTVLFNSDIDCGHDHFDGGHQGFSPCHSLFLLV